MRRVIAILGGAAVLALLVLVLSSRHATQRGLAPVVQSAGARAPDDTPTVRDFEFRHVVLDTTRDAPEFCLEFSADLSPRAEAHYADYVGILPAANTAIRAAGAVAVHRRAGFRCRLYDHAETGAAGGGRGAAGAGRKGAGEPGRPGAAGGYFRRRIHIAARGGAWADGADGECAPRAPACAARQR